MGMASIIVVILFQEYSVYSRTIKERVDTPDREGARGQAVFRNWIFGSRQYESGSYYC
jgi:hypothetical protein